MSDELDLRLLRGQMGGCTCGTKTPKLGAHDPQCKYRLCAEAATTIAALRADLAAKEVEIGRLREALAEVIGCFEAAQAEGLYDRLIEMSPHEPGNLRGLYERRLSFAKNAARAALAEGRADG